MQRETTERCATVAHVLPNPQISSWQQNAGVRSISVTGATFQFRIWIWFCPFCGRVSVLLTGNMPTSSSEFTVAEYSSSDSERESDFSDSDLEQIFWVKCDNDECIKWRIIDGLSSEDKTCNSSHGTAACTPTKSREIASRRWRRVRVMPTLSLQLHQAHRKHRGLQPKPAKGSQRNRSWTATQILEQ